MNIENFPNETDYRNPNIAEIMANLGYVNRFGSGVNTVSSLLEENQSSPAKFLLGDYTTFKVVVANADAIESCGNLLNNKSTIVVNETGTGYNSGTIGTMRNDEWNDWNEERNNVEHSGDISELVLEQMRLNKRISVKQLSKMFGKSKTTMFRVIEQLKSEGKVKRIGSEKSGNWEVI